MLTKKIIKIWNLHLYAHNHFFFYVFSGFSSKNKIFIFQFSIFLWRIWNKKINKSYTIFMYRLIIMKLLIQYILYYASTFLIQK